MQYLIMIHHPSNIDELAATGELSGEMIEEGKRAYGALGKELTASGELLGAHILVGPDQGSRVLSRDGQVSTTDGPFAELKEHLAGVFLVECGSRERAVEIAARIPEAAGGGVEVRPVATHVVSGGDWQSPSEGR